MNRAPVKGCGLLIERLRDNPELEPIKSIISAWYRAWEGPRDWTYCIKGSDDGELFMRVVPKSRCAVCKYASR